jgi:hypothetical protein
MSDPDLQRRGRDTTLESAAARLLDAVAALGRFNRDNVTYFEASPTQDAECARRWVELDSAGKLVKSILADRKASESSAVDDA